MSAADRRFRNLFQLIVGVLVSVAVGPHFLGISIADRHPKPLLEEPEYQRQVAAFIAPLARIAIAGRNNSALAIVPTTQSTPQATTPAATPTTGAEVFQQVYIACHGRGIGGAPRAGDAAAWSSRLARAGVRSTSILATGSKARQVAMPPKGGRVDLPDDPIRAAVGHLPTRIAEASHDTVLIDSEARWPSSALLSLVCETGHSSHSASFSAQRQIWRSARSCGRRVCCTCPSGCRHFLALVAIVLLFGIFSWRIGRSGSETRQQRSSPSRGC